MKKNERMAERQILKTGKIRRGQATWTINLLQNWPHEAASEVIHLECIVIGIYTWHVHYTFSFFFFSIYYWYFSVIFDGENFLLDLFLFLFIYLLQLIDTSILYCWRRMWTNMNGRSILGKIFAFWKGFRLWCCW